MSSIKSGPFSFSLLLQLLLEMKETFLTGKEQAGSDAVTCLSLRVSDAMTLPLDFLAAA